MITPLLGRRPWRLLLPLLSLVLAVSAVAASAEGSLTLREEPGVYTVEFSGRAGVSGIPSWKAVIRRDDAGNISRLQVPADDPRPLASRTGQWPLTIVMSKNTLGVAGTMTKGRENFARFPVERFAHGRAHRDRDRRTVAESPLHP